MEAEHADKKRMTRAGQPEDVRDLLDNAPRANIAFNNSGAIEAVPVDFCLHEEQYWVGMPRDGVGARPEAGDRVRLLIDDGCYHFDLRGMWVRGKLSQAEIPPWDGSPNLTWFRVEPAKAVVWDYGAMREARGG